MGQNYKNHICYFKNGDKILTTFVNLFPVDSFAPYGIKNLEIIYFKTLYIRKLDSSLFFLFRLYLHSNGVHVSLWIVMRMGGMTKDAQFFIEVNTVNRV